MADGVGELDFATGRESSGNDVLGDVAAHVGGAAVDFGRVYPAERATAVPSHAAVAVDDDLAASQTGVALRSTNNKTASGGDEVNGLLVMDCGGRDFLVILFV